MTGSFSVGPGVAQAANTIAQGRVTLVGGAAVINAPGTLSTDNASASLVSGVGTLGAEYRCVCTTDTLTITSMATTGIQVALDTSTVFYEIIR